jgi:hypothetical protein
MNCLSTRRDPLAGSSEPEFPRKRLAERYKRAQDKLKSKSTLPHTDSSPRSETGFEKRPFGRTDREASVIGEGTWYIERSDRRSAVAALRRALWIWG